MKHLNQKMTYMVYGAENRSKLHLSHTHARARAHTYEPIIKLRSASAVSKYSIYRFLLDHRKLLLNINFDLKVVILYKCSNSPLHHTHVLFTKSCVCIFLRTSLFYIACMQPLSCGRDIFVPHEK